MLACGGHLVQRCAPYNGNEASRGVTTEHPSVLALGQQLLLGNVRKSGLTRGGLSLEMDCFESQEG